MPAPTEEFCTQNQLAQRFDVTRRTVERWVQTGKAPRHIRIGGAVRFRCADVEQWLLDNEGK